MEIGALGLGSIIFKLMEITDIRPQRRKHRVSIYIDGEFWLGMDIGVLTALNLEISQIFDEERKAELEKEVAGREAVVWAIESITRRALSRAKMAEKLLARGYTENIVQMALERLEELYLINDQQVADSLVYARRSRGQGKRRVALALSEAGIEKEVTERVLDEQFDPEKEDEEAYQALIHRHRNKLDRPGRDKATAFLVRRGFSSQASRQACERHALPIEEELERYSPDAARILINKKYKQIESHSDRRRAQAFLQRRGFGSDAIRKALD